MYSISLCKTGQNTGRCMISPNTKFKLLILDHRTNEHVIFNLGSCLIKNFR